MGKYLTSCKIGVVFGGSDYGLLGVMGNAAAEDGGMVTGILPEFFTGEFYVKLWLCYTGKLCANSEGYTYNTPMRDI